MSFIPIYDIWLAPHEVFCFYETEGGALFSISSLEKPLVRIPNKIWDSKTKNWAIAQFPSLQMTIWVPTWGVKKEDMDEYLPSELMAAAQKTYSTLSTDKFALFVAQKELPCDLIEVGIFCPGLGGHHGDYSHNKWENSVDRYMRLKAFW